MKFKVTYYRTLSAEREIEAETLDLAKAFAEDEVVEMHNLDFDEVHEEQADIECEELQIPLTVIHI